MNNDVYWFITGISNRSIHPTDRTRCWGFFDDFAEAEQAVLENDGNIYEYEYEKVVIEGHTMGTLAMSTEEQHWYQFDEATGRFVPIDTPSWAAGIVGWGIG